MTEGCDIASSVEVQLDGGLQHVRILVVDDDEDCRELLVECLGAYGAIVESASDATRGLSKLQERPPDVLISDIGMPNVDGYEFVRMVRALTPSEGGSTPAIALTAYCRPEDRQRALDAGFQVHVAKPFDASSLIGKIVALLRGREPSLDSAQRVAGSHIEPVG